MNYVNLKFFPNHGGGGVYSGWVKGGFTQADNVWNENFKY